MNNDQTAEALNTIVLTKIAPSEIEGVGVFAIRDLPKGKKLYLDSVPSVFRISPGNLSRLFPEVKELLVGRWPRLFVDSTLAYPDGRYQAYVNHSDTPNYDPIDDVLLRDVKKGEEITENYRIIVGWREAFPWLAEENVL